MSTLGLYPKELVPDHLYFQWPDRTKTQHMCQKILKEGDGYHNYLRFPDLRDNNFDVMHSEIALDNVYLVCAETFKYKPTGNYSGFITYSNTLFFAGI